MPGQKTSCRICEAACGLAFEGETLRPDRERPVSRGFVCAKGTRFVEVAGHPSRLSAPMKINAILAAGTAHVEPLSGMLVMTGVPVEVRPAVRADASAPLREGSA